MITKIHEGFWLWTALTTNYFFDVKFKSRLKISPKCFKYMKSYYLPGRMEQGPLFLTRSHRFRSRDRMLESVCS